MGNYSWKRITSTEAQTIFKFPESIASNPNNELYLLYYGDKSYINEWKIVAFLTYPNQDNILTFHVCSLDDEQIEYFDGHLRHPFNLPRIGQYLNLERDVLPSLINLLSSQAQQLLPLFSEPSESLIPLPNESPISLAITNVYKNVDRTLAKTSLYQQIPPQNSLSDNSITILKFITSIKDKNKGTFFTIYQVNPEQLNSLTYSSFANSSIATIALGKNGLLELKELFELQLKYMDELTHP